MLDLDYFKSINDTYGHDASDEVLRQISNIKVTVTIGLAFYRNGTPLEKLLKEVDMLLYRGKNPEGIR